MIRKESASHFFSGKIRTFLKKHSWLFMLLLIAGAVFLYSRIPAAYAESTQERWQLRKKMETFLEAFKRTNFHYMVQAYERFRDLTADDSRFPFAVTVKRISLGLGYAMVVSFSLTGVIKESQKGEISMDYWFRIAAALVVAIVLVTSVGTVMDNLYGFGDYVISAAYNNMKDDSFEIDGEMTTTTGQKMSDVQKNNFLETLSYVPGLDGGEDGSGNIKELYETESDADASFFKIETASSVVTLMEYAVYAPLLVCMFLIFSAIFEVKVRQIFAPVAVAAIAYEGGRSTGVRFLKKYLACFVKIALYFTIAAIGAEMTAFFFARTTASAPNIEDGKLDLVMIRSVHRWQIPFYLPGLMLSKDLKFRITKHFRASDILIEGNSLRINVDGDISPMNSVEFRINPGSLMLIR